MPQSIKNGVTFLLHQAMDLVINYFLMFSIMISYHFTIYKVYSFYVTDTYASY